MRERQLAGSSVNCAVQAVRAFPQFVLGRDRAATVGGVPEYQHVPAGLPTFTTLTPGQKFSYRPSS